MSDVNQITDTTTSTSTTADLGEFGTLVNGQQIKTGDVVEIRSPYNNDLVAIVHQGGAKEVETAIASATEAFQETRQIPSWRRAEILEKISAGIATQRETFARAIALEAGKPIKTARGEVDRAIFTFKIAAEEAKRIYGEVVPLDWLPSTEGRMAQVHRVPLGPITGITPFNFPLNLVAHKVAPALAAGNPIIIRPGPQTPVCALLLGQLVLESGWPAGGHAVVPCSIPNTRPLVEDERLRMLSFTGSPTVGWMLKQQAGRKRVALELGGNAGTIIHHDANLSYAAQRVEFGGFSYAGQSCISVQRIYVHDDVYDSFVEELAPRVAALKVGDPLDEATDVGPVINLDAAKRIDEWLAEATAQGAEVLVGGQREENLWQPTLLTSVREEMRVSCQEIFGPIVSLYRYTDVNEALTAVDDSDFGLQAGLFTNDLSLVHTAFDRLEVGGLMVNDVSTFRVDHMPYGGVKQSGFGREGLRYAIEEMTEMKLLTFNQNV